MMIRVVVVDDEELVRAGLRLILESQPDIEVVGEAPDGQAAATLAALHHPDVVLMDVRMPVQDGIGGTADVLRASPRTRVIMLTTFDEDEYVFSSLRAGASGFLLKDSARSELLRAVREVMAGQSLLSPTATRRLISEWVRTTPSSTAVLPPSELSEREYEVLTLVARGLNNSEIASSLTLSEHTVKSHVANVLSKLGLRDRVQAVVYAYDHGIVGGPTG